MEQRYPKSPLGTSQDLQEAILNWVDWKALSCPFMVTPTFRQELGPKEIPLTPKKLSREVALWLNRLNRHVFGSAGKRYGRKIYTLTALESVGTTNLHCHLIIDCPRPELEDDFPRLLKRLWRLGYWAHQQIDVQKADLGGLKYVTKIWTKPNYLDNFDWDNTHLPVKEGKVRAGPLSNAPFLTDQIRPHS